MKNLLEKYLNDQQITMSDFARMLKASPSSVYHWKIGKVNPRAEMAWKMHKLTKGKIPINFWGYAIISGKIKKLDTHPILAGDFSPSPSNSIVSNE